MNESMLRRRLEWYGCDDQEIEDAIAAWADAENDRLVEEEYMKEKANEQA